jgi:hypothetical protein
MFRGRIDQRIAAELGKEWQGFILSRQRFGASRDQAHPLAPDINLRDNQFSI